MRSCILPKTMRVSQTLKVNSAFAKNNRISMKRQSQLCVNSSIVRRMASTGMASTATEEIDLASIAPNFTQTTAYNTAKGQSPVWDGRRLFLVDVDEAEPKIIVESGLGSQHTIIDMPQSVGAVFLTPEPNIILAAMTNNVVEVNVSQRTITRVIAAVPPEDMENSTDMRFGEGGVSPGGALFLGWRHNQRRSAGKLYKMDVEGGGPQRLIDVLPGFQIRVPGGIAWDERGDVMYLVDSGSGTSEGEGCIHAFRCDETGTPLGAVEGAVESKIVVTIPPMKGLPKGMTIDSLGRLWVALGGAGKVVCIDPRSGQQLYSVDLPINDPTSCTWGGPALDVLYVTSMRERGANGALGAGHTYAVQLDGVRGAAAAHLVRGLSV